MSDEQRIIEDDTAGLICANCEENLDDNESYQCKTCNSQKDESLRSWFCEQCLAVLHVKKGHEVCDCRGYKPKVCEKHRKLCLLFCNDCQIVFCDKCIGPHCEHKFSPSSEKASEARKSIFELLTKFEELTKPMKRRESNEKDTFDERDKIATSLDQLNFESTLTKMATKVIHYNLDLLYSMRSKANDSVERSDLIRNLSKTNDFQITELRGLLRSSDEACIELFLDISTVAEASLIEQEEVLKSHVYLQWKRDWESVILESFTNAMKLMNVPQVETKRYKQISFSPLKKFNNTGREFSPSDLCLHLEKSLVKYCFDVVLSGTRIDFTVYNSGDDVWKGFLTGVKVKFIGDDGRLALVQQRRVAKSQDQTQFLVDFSSKKMTKANDEGRALQICDLQGCKVIAAPDSSAVYVWNEKEKAIAGVLNSAFLMENVYTEPQFTLQRASTITYIDKEGKIILEHKKNKTRIEVIKCRHHLAKIDAVDLIYENDSILRVLLLDMKDRVVMKCRANLKEANSLSWEILEVFKLDIPSLQPVSDAIFCCKDRILACNEKKVFSGYY